MCSLESCRGRCWQHLGERPHGPDGGCFCLCYRPGGVHDLGPLPVESGETALFGRRGRWRFHRGACAIGGTASFPLGMVFRRLRPGFVGTWTQSADAGKEGKRKKCLFRIFFFSGIYQCRRDLLSLSGTRMTLTGPSILAFLPVRNTLGVLGFFFFFFFERKRGRHCCMPIGGSGSPTTSPQNQSGSGGHLWEKK